MPNKEIKHENINGIALCLDINSRNSSPNSVQFTISFGKDQKKSYWSKTSLIFAVIFNIIAMTYVQISLSTMLVIASVICFLLFFWITHCVQSESMLVIPTVGIQMSIKYICGIENSFIPWCSIEDVVINEVIQLNRVLYYLTVISKESDNIKLIPLFKYTKPRLLMLEAIYSEIQCLLRVYSRVQEDTMASGDMG